MNFTPCILLLLLFFANACVPAPLPEDITPQPTEFPADPPPATQPAGLPAAPDLTSDFEPPFGPAPDAPSESPGAFRLLAARSSDGLHFERMGQIITDQANVPDLIVDEQGWVYLYYTGGQVGNRHNATALAISADGGETWVFKYVEFSGFPGGPPVDPDIVRLPDGRLRMYVTTGTGGRIAIAYADSEDGIHFTYGGEAFGLDDANVLDSTTFFVDNTWQMFTLDGPRPEQWRATSVDGATFTPQGKTLFTAGGANYIGANGVPVDGGYRMYGFFIPNRDFRSFFSTDGVAWVAEEGVRLAFDPASGLEGSYIKDPAVARLADGSYLMVYVTRIPG